MVTVAEADRIIKAQVVSYGTMSVPIQAAAGHLLAEELYADRDLPPYDRVTMDGIAIGYAAFAKGIRSFRIITTMAAGDAPVELASEDECVEIMTGAALPASADTIIRYEDLDIADGIATVTISEIKKGNAIHYKGKDKKTGDVVVTANKVVDATVISMAATVGKAMLSVKKLPRVVIISTGDELVSIEETPNPYQLRQSNNYTLRSIAQQYGIAADMIHIPDDLHITKTQLSICLEAYDVILLTGGVSMGKFDYVPRVLEDLKVEQLFHKVWQRPGNPFWFGKHANGLLVFAFPGNPVSTFMCAQRYFVPWLQESLGAKRKPVFAQLAADISFVPQLQYFAQVTLSISETGQLTATPIEGNGSGDFANLVNSDAFMELPMERSNFNKGEVYPVWPFKPLS